MTWLAHFVGGPWDGRSQALPELWPEVRLHALGLVRWWERSSSPLPIETLVYRRRPGVVAGEAVYDWLADRAL